MFHFIHLICKKIEIRKVGLKFTPTTFAMIETKNNDKLKTYTPKQTVPNNMHFFEQVSIILFKELFYLL